MPTGDFPMMRQCPGCGAYLHWNMAHACAIPYVNPLPAPVPPVGTFVVEDLAALRSKYASAVRTLQDIAANEDTPKCQCEVCRIARKARETLARIWEPVEPQP